MMGTQIQPVLTLADLDAMPDDGNRYELIGGEIYASRAPHIAHQSVIANLIYALRGYLAENQIGKVLPEIGLILTEHDAVIPDLVFVRAERFYEVVAGGKLIAAPDLAIEVLSSGTENERRDRSVKRRLYGQHGVKEYWIINWELKTVEQYELEEQGLELRATLVDKDEMTSPLLPGFRISVARIFDV